jgi:hypothetical protein
MVYLQTPVPNSHWQLDMEVYFSNTRNRGCLLEALSQPLEWALRPCQRCLQQAMAVTKGSSPLPPPVKLTLSPSRL